MKVSVLLLVSLLACGLLLGACDRLSLLASTGASMRASAKAASAQRFVTNLRHYADKLEESADLVLLQADSMIRHRAAMRAQAEAAAEMETNMEAAADMEAEAQLDADADSDAYAHFGADGPEDPVDAMVAAHAAQEEGLSRQLETAFASGDAMGVVTSLEQANAIRLLPNQRTQLAKKVQATMKQVSDELRQSGQPLDRAALRGQLDGLLSEVADPEEAPAHPDGKLGEVGVKPMSQAEIDRLSSSDTPDWMAEVMVHAADSVNNKDSTLYKSMLSNAKEHELQTNPEVRQHLTDAPLEELMASHLNKALEGAKDPNSSFFKDMVAGVADHHLAHDPAIKPLHDAVQNPKGELFQQLVKEAKQEVQAANAPANAQQQAKQESQWMEDILKRSIDDVKNPDSSLNQQLANQAMQQEIAHNPDLQQAPAWMENILAGAVQELDAGGGELTKMLTKTAETQALLHPEAPSLDTLASSILSNVDEQELEAQIRFSARKEMLDDVVEKNKQECLRKRRRGQQCNLDDFVKGATSGINDILHSRVPAQLEDRRDEPLAASGSLSIGRSKTATPEAVRDVEASIAGGIDPWFDLPGRSTKALRVKSKTVADLLDAEGDRCPGRCSLRGQCIMDLNTTMKSPSGSQNVHPFICLCDTGYVGEACQIKLDMHLRWLLTEGAAPFPKCCNVCAKQRNAPQTYDDIPGYNNPFTAIEPKCLPFPRVSLYSREDGSHEMVKGRRPNPQCSHPLGEITRADPMVALELAADLGNAQQVLQSQLLTDMAAMAHDASHVSQMSEGAAHLHVARLRAASARLQQASESARKAAAKLAEKLHLPSLDNVKASSVDLGQLLADYRELPNDMEECCLFCDSASQADPLVSNQDPAANQGANAVLNSDPRFDNAIDAVHRRMAKKRQEERHAKLLGVEAPGEQDCCVVCPYNFREVERLTEAAHVRRHSAQSDVKKEMNRVFLETFAEVDRSRRRRHEPHACCPACPSQFLIAHAFPAGPFNTARTMPNQGHN